MEPRAGKSQSPAGPVDHGQSPAGRSMSRGGRRGGSARAPAACARAAPRPVMTSTTAPALDGARQPVARPLAAVPAAPSPRPDPESPRGGDFPAASRPPHGAGQPAQAARKLGAPAAALVRRPRGRIREPGRGSAIACRPVDHGLVRLPRGDRARPRWTQRQARPHGAGQPAQAARKLGAPARPWFVVPEAGSGSPGGGAQSPAGRSTTAAALRSPPRRNPGRLTAATWRWSDRSEVGGQALSPP